MEQLRKAFIMLSAALTASALAADGVQAAAAAAGKAPPPRKGEVKKKEQARGKKRVKRVRPARRRPSDFEPDLGMPAGTLYDVIDREDL
ncbi:MAG: hypothetical protein KKB20_30575 [Proteobacteria bacterium]|nr:hypothetical protein [Pseudomonadota bacterium]